MNTNSPTQAQYSVPLATKAPTPFSWTAERTGRAASSWAAGGAATSPQAAEATTSSSNAVYEILRAGLMANLRRGVGPGAAPSRPAAGRGRAGRASAPPQPGSPFAPPGAWATSRSIAPRASQRLRVFHDSRAGAAEKEASYLRSVRRTSTAACAFAVGARSAPRPGRLATACEHRGRGSDRAAPIRALCPDGLAPNFGVGPLAL